MNSSFTIGNIIGWLFTMLIFTLGILNLVLVHPVPGIAYMLLSLIFFPPVKAFVSKKTGFVIPVAFQIVLGFIIIWFTLGISDLGEMYGL